MTVTMNRGELAVTVDIGATLIKFALIERDGALLGLERIETPHDPCVAVDTVVEGMRSLARRAGVDLNRVEGFGVSIAAFITSAGRVVATAHLGQDWADLELGQHLKAALPGNYYFALDAPAPTLGEAYYGAGRGYDDFAYVTVSTGVGAGLLLHGKIYEGGLGWAGGIGHTVVNPAGDRVCTGCGNRGCLETYAGTQGIVALAREAAKREPSSILATGRDTEPLTPKCICDAAFQGDTAACSVFAEAGRYLGIGLTNLVDVLSVNRIVIGGGVALAGDLLLEPARAVVRQSAFPPDHRKVEIVPAMLGDMSGCYGVAAMVFNDIRINVEAGY